jgi:hypothetical protein
MAATVSIAESNGAGETVTASITNMNYGSTDAVNLVAATYPITVNTNSYIKYHRFNVTNMGTSNKIDNLQVWRTNTLDANLTNSCNLKTSAYGGAVAYATPSTTTFTDQSMPVADPANPNLGIGGVLAGNRTTTGYSDYFKHQLQVGAAAAAGNMTQQTFSFQYDES